MRCLQDESPLKLGLGFPLNHDCDIVCAFSRLGGRFKALKYFSGNMGEYTRHLKPFTSTPTLDSIYYTRIV